tara:strand:+ start:3196 stop:3375 length:180 start_codon:yes stop_codon:yes gene_type:complete
MIKKKLGLKYFAIFKNIYFFDWITYKYFDSNYLKYNYLKYYKKKAPYGAFSAVIYMLKI